jgi:two-component system, chemotaxis family, sensor kinase CheA
LNFFSDERAAEMRELFFESAAELLQTLNDEGLKMEKEPGNAEILRQVRRAVHTLKGDSAACGFQEFSELAHALEDALKPEVAASAQQKLAEVVLIAADTFASMLSAYRGDMQPPQGAELRQQITSLRAPAMSKGRPASSARFAWSEYEHLLVSEALSRDEAVFNVAISIDPQCPMRAAAVQLIRNVLSECGVIIAITPLGDGQAETVELIEVALASNRTQEWLQKKCFIPSIVCELIVHRVTSDEENPKSVQASTVESTIAEPAATASAPAAQQEPTPAVQTQAEKTEPRPELSATSFSANLENLLRVDAERIDAVLNLVGELVIAKSMLHQAVLDFEKRFPKDPLRARFTDAMAFQARIMNDLQKSVMKIRMVPVEHLFRRFPRLVRDVAKSCGKDVNLVVTGQDTDLDKSILDMLAEPIAHIVRNCVDHGIEAPEERTLAGKQAEGTVWLAAYHQGNQIIIEVTDDGRGIDRDRLIARAIETGILEEREAAELTEDQALDLMFHPGLSTASEVTSISGRGVGMDVVKTVLERLKGSVSIRTTSGKGTTFSLQVPLTLAIIKALLFRVADRIYAVPLSNVVEITRASLEEVHSVDHQNVIRLREEIVPLIHLRSLTHQSSPTQRMFVVVVTIGERKFGLVVDKMLAEEELVIKALDDQLVKTDLVSGASILGDGTVVLILNIATVVSRLGRAQMKMGATA